MFDRLQSCQSVWSDELEASDQVRAKHKPFRVVRRLPRVRHRAAVAEYPPLLLPAGAHRPCLAQDTLSASISDGGGGGRPWAPGAGSQDQAGC